MRQISSLVAGFLPVDLAANSRVLKRPVLQGGPVGVSGAA